MDGLALSVVDKDAGTVEGGGGAERAAAPPALAKFNISPMALHG